MLPVSLSTCGLTPCPATPPGSPPHLPKLTHCQVHSQPPGLLLSWPQFYNPDHPQAFPRAPSSQACCSASLPSPSQHAWEMTASNSAHLTKRPLTGLHVPPSLPECSLPGSQGTHHLCPRLKTIWLLLSYVTNTALARATDDSCPIDQWALGPQ